MLIDGEVSHTNDDDDARYDFDLFVIGAGSGGVRASRFSASFGAKVSKPWILRVQIYKNWFWFVGSLGGVAVSFVYCFQTGDYFS